MIGVVRSKSLDNRLHREKKKKRKKNIEVLKRDKPLKLVYLVRANVGNGDPQKKRVARPGNSSEQTEHQGLRTTC